MNEILSIVENEQYVKNMLEINPDIKELSDKEIYESLNLLIKIGCNQRQLKNIIIANPFYLSRSTTDIIELIGKLRYLGMTNLNITFDSNPYLLNKDDYEIDEFLEEKRNENMELEDIIDLIDAGELD